MGPLAFEDATNSSPPLEISYDDAMKILRKSGQLTPIGLHPEMRKRKIIRRAQAKAELGL